eukprot:1152485-Pleurochrysis_carterae.AAC.2
MTAHPRSAGGACERIAAHITEYLMLYLRKGMTTVAWPARHSFPKGTRVAARPEEFALATRPKQLFSFTV